MPTKVVYVGPSEGVTIADTGQYAAKGAEVEVETELAERLLEQDVWARPTAKAAEAAKKEAK